MAEPFQRGSERIRSDHAGVGLGLAIVKSIAQAHDGTLTLSPRPDGGLQVAVELPPAPPVSLETEAVAIGPKSSDIEPVRERGGRRRGGLPSSR
jgi:hypothetical protein